jgi:NDP-sugar pyrophosphorylase family protein
LIAIILAGGYARRLQSFSNNTSKRPLKVHSRPIVGHIFGRLAEIEDMRRTIVGTTSSISCLNNRNVNATGRPNA